MTLAEAGEIFAYWADNPPTHLMLQVIARLLGWAPQQAAPACGAGPPPGVPVVAAVDSGFPAPVFDLEALRQRNSIRAARAKAAGASEYRAALPVSSPPP